MSSPHTRGLSLNNRRTDNPFYSVSFDLRPSPRSPVPGARREIELAEPPRRSSHPYGSLRFDVECKEPRVSTDLCLKMWLSRSYLVPTRTGGTLSCPSLYSRESSFCSVEISVFICSGLGLRVQGSTSGPGGFDPTPAPCPRGKSPSQEPRNSRTSLTFDQLPRTLPDKVCTLPSYPRP